MFSMWFNAILFHEGKVSLPFINQTSMATSSEQAQKGNMVGPEPSILHFHKSLRCCRSMPMLSRCNEHCIPNPKVPLRRFIEHPVSRLHKPTF
uniref:Uncharacterized protein n=1 Tax=Arundo donax TaxID=35708 RepID=A0A0A9GP39_ARUDO